MPTCHETKRHTPPHFTLRTVLALLGCLMLTACGPNKEALKEPASANTYFPIQLGDKTLQLQLALTPEEHQKGLMFRKSLAQDHGMLFLFQRAKKQGFWMKNTSLPLDIGYLDPRGQLLEVHLLFPFDETGVASRSSNILIAIETNRDWYTKNNIKPGAQLDMQALRAAIVERGFSVATYAIED